MKIEKRKPIIFLHLSIRDVEYKNASSINVTLSRFLFFYPLATKFYCFLPKYLLNIEMYEELFHAKFFVWLIFCLCSNMSTKDPALVLCHTIAFIFSSTFLPKWDPLIICSMKLCNEMMIKWCGNIVIMFSMLEIHFF